MKTITKRILFALSLSLFIICTSSCKKDNISEPGKTRIETKIKGIESIDGPKEMMTLSAIAMRFHQGGREALAEEMLAMSNLATQNKWELVWYAYNEKKSAQMMVVRHKEIPDTYSIVAKGQKQDNIYSLYQGIYVFQGSEWPWVKEGASNIHIAKGAMSLAKILWDIKSEAPKLGVNHPVNLNDLFQHITNNWTKKNDLNVYVAGHSLGGANAVMIGTYIHSKLSAVKNVADNKIKLRIFNFAGPNLFQTDFVDYYNNLKKDQHIDVQQRFYLINNDVVCNLWPHKMDGLNDVFPWGWTMKVPVKLFTKGFNLLLHTSGQEYKMVGSTSDGSRVYMDNATDPKLYDLPEKIYSMGAYAKYYGYYHFTDNYLRSLGATAVPEVEDGQIIRSKKKSVAIGLPNNPDYSLTEEDVNRLLLELSTPPCE